MELTSDNRSPGETLSMRTACLAVGVFLLAFLIHLIVWRVRLPRRHVPALFVILFGMLPVGLLLCAAVASHTHPLAWWEYAHIALFHAAISLAYIDVYPGLEKRSPRMTIATIVARTGSEGADPSHIHALLGAEAPLETRLQAMIEDRMVNLEDHIYVLTRKGRILGWFFWFGQELARLKKQR